MMLRIFLTIALAAFGMGASSANAAADIDGKALVQQTCATCHTLARGQGANEGPNLFGVVGRQAGIAPGFRYSAAFQKALAGKSWTPELLDQWLADSQSLAPGSGMILLIDDSAERRAIIDTLSQLRSLP